MPVTIPTYWFQGLVALVIVLFFLLIALIMAIKTKMPEAPTLLKASLFNRPVVQVHTNIGETKLFAPAPEGKKHDGNMYDIPGMGVKLIPNPTLVEHLGTRRHIQYFSKGGIAVSARVAAACRDFEQILRQQGIEPTEAIIDSILVADDQELIDRYPPVPVLSGDNVPNGGMFEEDGVMWRSSDGYNMICQLRDELKNAVVRDGQFVFQIVQNFIFAVQAETSRGLDEYCSIANERAVAAAGLTERPDHTKTIFLVVFLVFAFAIAYKVMFG